MRAKEYTVYTLAVWLQMAIASPGFQQSLY